jgi:hypothetical protein
MPAETQARSAKPALGAPKRDRGGWLSGRACAAPRLHRDRGLPLQAGPAGCDALLTNPALAGTLIAFSGKTWRSSVSTGERHFVFRARAWAGCDARLFSEGNADVFHSRKSKTVAAITL